MTLRNHLHSKESHPSSDHTDDPKKSSSVRCILIKLAFFLFFVLIAVKIFGQSPEASVFQGSITDPQGEPLQFVHVYLEGTATGNVTNVDGVFSFSVRETGPHTLVASLVGFIPYKKTIRITPSDTLRFEITLKEELQELGKAVITASSFTTGNEEGVTLNPIEVVTTPGAAADIFRAIQSFPGVTAVDEGSGLFVRGGDISETKILLDQATVVHPYKYETPTGGVFGAIPPFLVTGTFFSSGGFPARYGNALSGILAMESQGLPDRNTANMNLGLAAASAGISTQVIPDKLGVNFSGNQSFTETMFRLNGQAHEFSQAPVSSDLNLNLIYKPQPGSTFKVFSFLSQNKVGVSIDQPSYNGNYKGDESNQLFNLQWIKLLEESEWLVKNSLSMNRFSKHAQLGGMDTKTRDITYKFRSDWEKQISSALKFYSGFEAVHKENRFSGKLPEHDDVTNPNASFFTINEQFDTRRFGAYTEVDVQAAYRLLLNVGVRTDYHKLANEFTLDPRLSVKYQFDKSTNLRASAGIYHQFPQPYEYNPQSGNPSLASQQSIHYILGFEHKTDLIHFRAEGYYKDYDQLIIPDNNLNLSNRGYGDARGIDLFLRYSEFLQSRFNGWISYSFLQSKRYQARNEGYEYTFEFAPSEFDITHTLNFVGKYRLFGMVYAGMSYRYATGRPFTPVIDAVKNAEYDYYLPVEGPLHSERLPDFQRMDINLSYYWPLKNNQSVTFYLSVSNALKIDNITDYTYNEDYTHKQPVYSNYNRFYYAGVTANINL
ncbi:MAG: TonB-dependent receptor [Balneolaceae bacterium]|nr:TonB-dependent receptor [Balneolaceae bacterium]